MRWLFASETERAPVLRAIDDFWQAFQGNREALNRVFQGESDFDIAEFMGTYLGAVHPHLMWEFGPGIAGSGITGSGHRLAIAPEHRFELTELARAMIIAAPEVEGWQFYLGRPPESADDAAAMVSARTGGDISDLRVEVERGRANLIDLQFFSDVADRDDTYLAAQTVLGESFLASWVGGIAVDVLAKATTAAAPLPQLQSEADRARLDILKSLPEYPGIAEFEDTPFEGKETALIETTRDQADDYPMLEDRITWLAPNIEFVEAVYHGWFSSERFSTSGEIFAYLKIDGSTGLEDSAFEDRAEIEAAVNRALTTAGVGRVHASGHGLRYSYIDLALADLARGSHVALATLAEGNITNRSWLHLHDRQWTHEWLGAYPDTPPPLLPA